MGFFLSSFARRLSLNIAFCFLCFKQVNFFEDHTKVIISPDAQDYLVTFINSSRQAVNYRLLQLRHFGCTPVLRDRLVYARSMLESIINIEGEAV